MAVIAIHAYNRASAGARNLRDALRVRLHGEQSVEMPPNDTIRLRNHDVVNIINWGSANVRGRFWRLEGKRVALLNSYEAVNRAGNKLLSFSAFEREGVPCVAYSVSSDVAQQWQQEGHTIVARTVLRGHSGEGIIIVEPNDFIPPASLYTKYKKKKFEYRVHVFKGSVIDIQQKRREREFEGIEDRSKIRNRANGWVFCRENLEIVDDIRLKTVAVMAVRALGLDFGAVDIIYNAREDSYYVLEVNTAPGLEGTTLEKYVDAFSSWSKEVVARVPF